jgi:crotonobetainyl-CoA:carnitine CoA-transferase CaiB-like acyl-CoA transferase
VAFCSEVLRRPELAADDRFDTGAGRVAHRPALHAEIDAVLEGLTGTELVDRLGHARIAYGRRREVADVLEHPQLTARERWAVVDSPGGPVRTLLPPITLPGRPPRLGPIPAVGEHTEAVRAWLDSPVPEGDPQA